jgi:hypothetical protein
MTNISTPWGSLTLTTKLAANLTAGTDVVVGIDGSQTSRDFSPGQYVGYFNESGPQTGDAASLWLPTAGAVSQVAVDSPNVATGQSLGTVYGNVTAQLLPPPKLAGYYMSPMVYTLAPDDLVTVASGSF